MILLLLAAAAIGIHNIQSIQQNAASLVREQSVTNRLIDELHRQQTSLSEVFSVMARDPDSLDYDSHHCNNSTKPTAISTASPRKARRRRSAIYGRA